MKILAIVGSLREHSYNRQLAEITAGLMPEGVDYEIVLADLPLFNEDIEFPAPPEVVALREKVKEADGFWIFSPEYNHAPTGPLKNTLDWLSRPTAPGEGNVLTGTKATYSGAGFGLSGSTGAQDLLVMLLGFLSVGLMNSPRTTVPLGRNIDEEGNLQVDRVKPFLQAQVDAFVPFLERFGV